MRERRKTTRRNAEPPAGPRLLTRLELARVLDIGPQRLAKYAEEGMPVAERGRGGRASRYDEKAVRAWLAERGKVTTDGRVGTASAVAAVAVERARKERAQAVLAEQLAASRGRDLLPREEVKRAWEAVVIAVRTKLLAAPATYSDRLIRAFTLDGSVGHERAFAEVMREVCRELAAGGAQVPTAKGRKGQAA